MEDFSPPEYDPDEDGEGGLPPVPPPNGKGPVTTPSGRILPPPLSADLLAQMLGGGGPPRGRGRAGRRETLTDVLNALGKATIGVSWDAASPAEKNALRRIYGVLDKKSLAQSGKSYRDLSPDARTALREGEEFSVLSSDDTAAQSAMQSMLKADFAKAVAAGEITPDEYRDRLVSAGLPKEVAQLLADRARAETKRKGEAAATKAFLAVPEPLPAPETRPAAPAPRPALSWSSLARAIPAEDLRNLSSAWYGGSLGDTAINPLRLQHLMASFPIADNPTEFLSILRNLWATGGGQPAAAQRQLRAPAVPRVPTIRFRSPLR